VRLARRAFLGLLGVALAPGSALAQAARTPHRIGWLSSEARPDPFVDGFRDGLQKLGYVEGRDFVLELRYTSANLDALRAALDELVKARVAFIVSSGFAIQATKAVQDTTVLFAISGDPVALGIARSLARPGGNFTGSTFMSLEVAGKRVALLKEAVPRIRTLAALSNINHPGEPAEHRATAEAAQAVGVKLVYARFAALTELDAALGGIREARPDAVIVFPDAPTVVNRAKLAQFAVSQNLPSMFGWSEYVDAGGLMSYGANTREAYVRLATYADRLLRGARAGELPIERPTRFELVVNLKTARALGITLPSPVLLAADRVIE
jgi:putative ABC transport system substrate-binding protein